MASKTIPARLIVTCDRCGAETPQAFGRGRRRREGVLLIKSHGLDNLGDPCCKADRSYDLCDDCLFIMERAIVSAMVLEGSERR